MAIIDATFLKENYLFGVRLTDSKGVAYPAGMFTHVIAAAEGFVSRVLNLPIGGTDYTAVTGERHEVDPTGDDCLYLHKGPVREITSFQLRYGNAQLADVPLDWLSVIDEHTGECQIIPTSGSVSYQMLAATRLFTPARLHGTWMVGYTAGFKASDAPDELKQLVALIAATPVLITAGDLILGAGIATSATSLDGLSRSIGTTSSATNSGYGSRIIENRKIIDALVLAIKGSETGPFVAGL